MFYIGCHLSASKGFLHMAKEAVSIGANTFQFFTRNPRGGKAKDIDKKELAFIGMSGIATGASWLCYYYAVQTGILSVVVPIDKMSILITVIFSVIFLKEKLSWKTYAFIFIVIIGILLLAVSEEL